MWVLYISELIQAKQKRFTSWRKKRLTKIVIRMNKYVNKGYNTIYMTGESSNLDFDTFDIVAWKMVSSLVSHPQFRLSVQYQTVQTPVNSKVSSWERRLIWSRGTRKHCKLRAGSRRARVSCQYQVWQRATQRQLFTALLKNTRILRFKSQLTFEFFAAVNHLSGPLRKQNFSLTDSKGHGLWLVDFDPFFVF